MASNYTESSIYSPFCPTGTILPYLGSTLPTGWNWLYPTMADRTLKCSNTTYGTQTSSINGNLRFISQTGISHTHNTLTSGSYTDSHAHNLYNYYPMATNTSGTDNEFGGSNSSNAGGLTTYPLGTGGAAFSNHIVTVANAGLTSPQGFDIRNSYYTVHWIIKL